jgi:hypothetical protein
MLATGGRFPPQLREPEPMHGMVDAGPVTFSPNNCFQGFPFSLGPGFFRSPGSRGLHLRFTTTRSLRL